MELDEVTARTPMATHHTWSRRALTIGVAVGSLVAFVGGAARAQHPDRGILLLAHGGSASWNAAVTDLSGRLNERLPTEVAFGMATRATMQAAVDRLTQRGVHEIVGVPLFISSHSSVIEATQYLLGVRTDAPADLAMFARMSHGVDATSHTSHAAPDDASEDGTRPVRSAVPIRMVGALDDHPIVADILTSRARAVSRNPAEEALVIVAHGPNGDDENRRWLADMASLAQRITGNERFASIDYLTLRDDAPKAVRDQATAELRELVGKRIREGRRVLITPLLVPFGGIERGLRERLQGLTYTMATAGLMPDDRLVACVLAMAGER